MPKYLPTNIYYYYNSNPKTDFTHANPINNNPNLDPPLTSVPMSKRKQCFSVQYFLA